jgi:hypothetical protein
VIDTVLQAPEYHWSQTSPRLSWLGRWWMALTDWLDRLQESNPVAARLLFWGLVVILVAIFVHGGWIMYQTIKAASAAEGAAADAIPIAIRDERWYLRLAERLAAEGRYAEAMQAAFTGLVLRLDARGILRYHPSKTPREYAREARLLEDSRQGLQESVGTLYACAYAGRPCGPEQYRDWLSGLKREWHAAPN